MPANHGQLTFLTTAQRTAFAAGSGRIHAEFVVVSWPSPNVETVYAWSNWLADPIYTAPLTTWLAGRPLIPAFAAQNKSAPFHDIVRSSGLNDDTVTLRFSNAGRTIESLIRTHGSGVKIEFFWFFPQVDGGTCISWFLGTLKTPQGLGSINKDFVTLTAVGGLASPNIIIPNFSFPQQCPVRFGGEMTVNELYGHPCSYNRQLTGSEQTALGGAKGLLNAGVPFPDCPHTEQACVDRFGHKLVYMGVKAVTETVPVGAGEHKTYSTTHGRYGSLIEPASVIFGERDATAVLVDFRKEINPSPSHPEAGTLVTLFVGGVGPVQEVTNVQLMERTPQGLDMRLGTQEQTATVFSPLAPSLNRRIVMNANHNPEDPSKIQVEQMKLTFHCKGRNTVRVYSAQDAWTEQYTNNRAWALLELLENTWYGLRLARSRLLVSDFIYLAGKNVSFNCQVTARTAQQQLHDILESARWYPPFYYHSAATGKGQWRWLPIEELVTTQADIPTFTDTGANRNIVVNNGISTVTPSYLDEGEIPNDVYVQFDDADHKNITRPLHFPDWTAQARAGAVYGDYTKRPITKTYTAYGITALSEAVPLGAFLRDLGPFGQGGLANNLEVSFVTRPAIYAEALELHPNKAIKLVSSNLDPAIYKDPNGDPFTVFIVKRMERTSEADLLVTVQAYGKAHYGETCSPLSGYVVWTDNASVIDGPHGADTKILGVGTVLGSTGVTWPNSINQADVVVDRWVHTIDELPVSDSYNVWHSAAGLGFKVWYNGQGWIYHGAGIDTTTFPTGPLQPGDTLGIEFDKNAGSPIRRYKRNGVTIRTDTTGVVAVNQIEAIGFVAPGILIGDVFWEVFPCTPGDEQEGGSSGGGTGTGGSLGYGIDGYGNNYGL